MVPNNCSNGFVNDDRIFIFWEYPFNIHTQIGKVKDPITKYEQVYNLYII